jgi:hypothetical protein
MKEVTEEKVTEVTPDELAEFTKQAEVEEAEEAKGKGKKKGRAKKEKKVKEPKPKRDNIAYVQGLRNIESVRKFHQIAIAKKAKSIHNPVAVERYEKEIEASKQVLEALLAEAAAAPNPLEKLVEMGEELNKVITFYIQQKEREYDEWVERNEFKVPKATLKSIPDDIPADFLGEIPLDLIDTLNERHGKSDFRLKAICRKFNFVFAVESGKLQNVEGKWVAEGTPATAPAPKE